MGCSASGQRQFHKGFNFYAVECIGEQPVGELDIIVDEADPQVVTACEGNAACIIDAELTDGTLEEKIAEGLKTLENEKEDAEPPSQEEINANPAPPKVDPKTLELEVIPTTPGDVEERNGGGDDKEKASGSGDPHLKTWTGNKYDYHGECDLVLLDHPAFNNGQGLRVHIRTTRVKYFSFISTIAVQIGDDIVEFENDAENFLLNGVQPTQQKHHKTRVGGFQLRRDPKALSIRIHDEGRASHGTGTVVKIDLHARKNGFPAVIVDGGKSDMFRGSLGLLGDWETGRYLARDGKTEVQVDPMNASEFALEWQVRDTEPMLFSSVRAPQYPATCIPPKEIVGSRIGMQAFKLEAEEACGHWEQDMDDCIFDVMATRDILVAEEGHIVHTA